MKCFQKSEWCRVRSEPGVRCVVLFIETCLILLCSCFILKHKPCISINNIYPLANGWGMHYVNECLHSYRKTSVCVCLCVKSLLRRVSACHGWFMSLWTTEPSKKETHSFSLPPRVSMQIEVFQLMNCCSTPSTLLLWQRQKDGGKDEKKGKQGGEWGEKVKRKDGGEGVNKKSQNCGEWWGGGGMVVPSFTSQGGSSFKNTDVKRC